MSRAAPSCGEHRDLLFAEGLDEGGVGRREHFEGPIRSPSCCHRVGLPEEDGRGLVGPERAQCDTSRVEAPAFDSLITVFERLFGGVDGPSEGGLPVTASSRDPRLDPVAYATPRRSSIRAAISMDSSSRSSARCDSSIGSQIASNGRAAVSAASMPPARATRTDSSTIASRRVGRRFGHVDAARRAW